MVVRDRLLVVLRWQKGKRPFIFLLLALAQSLLLLASDHLVFDAFCEKDQSNPCFDSVRILYQGEVGLRKAHNKEAKPLNFSVLQRFLILNDEHLLPGDILAFEDEVAICS